MRLEALRREIDEIDAQIIRLLGARAVCALRIGEEKRKIGAPLLDQGREHKVLERVKKLNGGGLDAAQIEAIYSVIIKECARIQERAAGAPPPQEENG